MHRETVEVFIELCHPEARIPAYARPDDAGMDVYTVGETNIEPGETVIIPTGLKVALPAGFEIQIRPRSGLSSKTPLRIANSPGTIDAGYREEIGIIMQNTSREESVLIKKGDRIAQMVLQRVPQIKWCPVANVANIGNDRGGGFGSSGR